MMTSFPLLVLAATAAPVPALPAATTMGVVSVDAPDPQGVMRIELVLFAPANAPLPVPAQITAILQAGHQRAEVLLDRAATANVSTLSPGAVRRVAYQLRPPEALPPGPATLILPGSQPLRLAVDLPTARDTAPAAPAAAVTASGFTPAEPVDGIARDNGFLASLSAYEPIYAVFGSGTNSNGKVQISFKYQLFGATGLLRSKPSWLDGLHFAYTQRMYWDIGANSAPFRNIDFVPEIFYLHSAPADDAGRSWSGQIGLRHQSNGRDGPASRSYNIAYVQPALSLPVTGDTILTVAPQAWVYFGGQRGNPDIERYRGHTGLALSIGTENGLKLATSSRYNFSSGKGAVQGELSYPLARLIGRDINLYVFGQAFTGYGEGLLDYDRRDSRLRVGLGIVR